MKIVKNIFFYYFLIFFPLVALIMLRKYDFVGEYFLVIGLLSYIFIYRPLIDGFRLYYKGIFKKNEIFTKSLRPWLRIKFFKELYLK